MKGTLNVVSIPCDQAANQCLIPVKAPGFALVFLTDAPALEIEESTMTFATTARTKVVNTATVPPEVLATSNGQSGKDRVNMGSTSKGSANTNGGMKGKVLPGLGVVVSLVGGGALVLMGLMR